MTFTSAVKINQRNHDVFDDPDSAENISNNDDWMNENAAKLAS